jgi:hypothetical protein
MGIKTGRPRGRPKGAKNKRTVERDAEMMEMATRIASVVGGAFEDDALAYLTSIYKDPAKPENVRMDAAKAAIRYERPALAPVEQAPETYILAVPYDDEPSGLEGVPASLVEPNFDPSRILASVEGKGRYRWICGFITSYNWYEHPSGDVAGVTDCMRGLMGTAGKTRPTSCFRVSST